jgi:hypothetical protein
MTCGFDGVFSRQNTKKKPVQNLTIGLVGVGFWVGFWVGFFRQQRMSAFDEMFEIPQNTVRIPMKVEVVLEVPYIGKSTLYGQALLK